MSVFAAGNVGPRVYPPCVLLQILTIAVPLLVAVLTTLRWPTLQRRAHGHVQMLKDLPEGTGKEFRDVVEEELTALAKRARRSLNRGIDYWDVGARIAVIGLSLGTGLFVHLSTDENNDSLGSVVLRAFAVSGVTLAVVVLLTLMWVGTGFQFRVWTKVYYRIERRKRASARAQGARPEPSTPGA